MPTAVQAKREPNVNIEQIKRTWPELFTYTKDECLAVASDPRASRQLRNAARLVAASKE